MSKIDTNQVLQSVREHYGRAARNAGGCGSDQTVSGCCRGDQTSGEAVGRAIGYTAEQLQGVVEDANLGLGCGNPNAYGQIKAGEVVLDLGSGGGFDCFIAAKAVGDSGRVIGVDMTPEMITLARRNTRKMKTTNVEFRHGQIEQLPVEDRSVDVIISNCVINLSPDKKAVFREAFRVLKPGGRLAVSDVVTSAELPRRLREDVSMLTGCIAGALTVDKLEAILASVGFRDIRIATEPGSRQLIEHWMPDSGVQHHISSARIEAVKPITPTNKRRSQMKPFTKGLDTETQLLVAAGSAVAAGCIPCLESITAMADEEGIDNKKLRAAAIIGQFVKDQPAGQMKKRADELLGTHLGAGGAAAKCPLENDAAGSRQAEANPTATTGCGCS